MATIPELVDQLAKAFAEVEAAEVKLKKFPVRDLINQLVEAKQITKFEGMARVAQFEGVASGNLGNTAFLHLDWTRKAQSLGIDIPQTEDGGGGR